MTRYEMLEWKKSELQTAYANAVKNHLSDMSNIWLAKKNEIDRIISNLTVEEAEREH